MAKLNRISRIIKEFAEIFKKDRKAISLFGREIGATKKGLRKTRRSVGSLYKKARTPREELAALERQKRRYKQASKINRELWKRKKLIWGSGAVAGLLGGGYYGLKDLKKRQEYTDYYKDYALQLQKYKQLSEMQNLFSPQKDDTPDLDKDKDIAEDEDIANDMLDGKTPSVPPLDDDMLSFLNLLKDLFKNYNPEPFNYNTPDYNAPDEPSYPPPEESPYTVFTKPVIFGILFLVAIIVYLGNKKRKKRRKK